MVPCEAECCKTPLTAASLKRMLFGIVLRPLCYVPLELCSLLLAMLSQRIVPCRDAISISVPTHPV
jgi:hypothetical protein